MDFIRPDKGQNSVLGQDAHRQATSLKTSIGYMSSDSQLIDHWNSIEHLRFYRSIRQHANKTINELVRALDLNPRIAVKQMSSGNRQKLGFILSLVGNPELLILDEPTKGLDPLAQNTFYEILRSYTRQGGTVLLSSHNLSEVERVCSNVAIIRSGRIVADMSMQNVRAMKTHIITATFDNPDNTKMIHLDRAQITQNSPEQIIIKTRMNINQVMGVLTQYKLSDLEVTHAPLEDIFMEYYK
jgi:ABC-2 type transport system ATP-binding protein